MEGSSTGVEPLVIPLSAFQQARLASLTAERASIDAKINEAVTTVVGHDHDPVQMAADGWRFKLDAAVVICTPPTVAQDP